jgi:SAM-dependent methyltransferase
MEYSKFRAGKESEMTRLELQAKTFQESIAKQISLLGIEKGTKVLDAGCGTGSFARAIAKIVLPEVVEAVDIDQVFIEDARKLSEKEGITNIDFKVSDISTLSDFSSQTFDVAYCKFVLPHLKDPSSAISELIRVTKSGGHLASMDEGGLYVYPPGSLDKYFELFGKWQQWRKATQNTDSAEKLDAHSLFTRIGLNEISVYPIPTYASSRENPGGLKDLATVPRQLIEIYRNEIVGKGFMTETEYAQGMDELEKWLRRPDSFWLVLTIFTMGRVQT